MQINENKNLVDALFDMDSDIDNLSQVSEKYGIL